MEPKKVIFVTGCNTDCPLRENCKAWKKLTPKQRVTLNVGVGIPQDFILKDCPLEDVKPSEE